jgi:D-serine deaminase-like pyridoxal phosphate-dependent protein
LQVQTPLWLPPAIDVRVGDPVFFRPAKAGEIAERFNQYLVIKNGVFFKEIKTYRGLGWNFF